MPENNKTEEFLQKLAPCIERSDLDACVEEAERMEKDMGGGTGSRASYLCRFTPHYLGY